MIQKNYFWGLALLTTTALASHAAAVKSDIDPYIGKITSHYVGKTGTTYSKLVDAGGWLKEFSFSTNRFSDVSYLIPFTGTDFDAPIPTVMNPMASNQDGCLEHMNRLYDIALALRNKGWTSASTIDSATKVLIAGMNYWSKINPYSYFNANGTLRYPTTAANAAAAPWYSKFFTQESYVRDVILSSQGISQVTANNLISWATVIEDTFEDSRVSNAIRVLRGTYGTIQNGTNWWWRIDQRIVRSWINARYGRADTLLYAAHDSVNYTIVPTGGYNYTSSGLRLDGTWNQHGIPYNGWYGKGGVEAMISFAQFVSAMKYSISATSWHMITDFMLDGNMRVSYRGIWSPDVLGRYYTQSYLKNNVGATAFVQDMTSLKSQNYRNSDLDAAITWVNGGAFPWLDQPAKVFPFGDAATWVRSNAAVFWRGTSKRLTRTESYNSGDGTGNDLAFDQGMGTHWILTNDGHQYFDGFLAVMDYSLYPGVTADSLTTLPSLTQTGVPSTGGGRIYGTRTFIGGASDGKYAAIAQDYDMAFQHGPADTGKFTAKKSLFFVDSAVVVLTAAMKWNEPVDVRTGINQLQRRGDFLVASGATGTTPTSLSTTQTISSKNLRWAWHDSVGYIFPNNLTTTAASETRSAPTSRVGWTDGKTVTVNVASLWLSHGLKNVNAAGDSFSYAFYPGISRTDFAALADNARAGKIWIQDVNSDTVQAVSLPVHNWHGIVFHAAASATLNGAMHIKASRPCTVMLQTTSDSLKLWVSDPSQLTTFVNISFTPQLQDIAYDATNKWTTQTISLSSNPDSAGYTVYKAWRLYAASSSSSSFATSSSSITQSSSSVSSSSSKITTSSSTAASSSSQATTNILNTPTLEIDPAPVLIFDLMGHRVGVGNNALQSLSHGTWIVVHTTTAGLQSEVRRLP